MKKVICIDTPLKDYKTGRTPEVLKWVVEGEVYTVTNIDELNDRVFYCLLELMPNDYWDAECFAPLSEIDETEMIREYNTVTKN